MSFRIKDVDGRITVTKMRGLFEQSIRQTPIFRDNTPLGIMEVNGQFSHYMNADTDTMWIGFAIGMRCAERLQDYARAAIAADRAKRFEGPVLTDDQIETIAFTEEMENSRSEIPDKVFFFARAIESAVLAKIKEQS
ncbi:MAG: hypothetical protein EPN62_08570 [Candidimonas sp.]|nr:MAG: hypothetical protein EPN77_05805 [Candidimonas sp.]TAM23721.1 MAG: hypothetical protein EPN62_08570 [Candidimonas sp.]